MAAKTTIEWTNRTWNPLRGCSQVSAGCKNCYAMRQAHRFSGPGKPFEGLTKASSKGPIWTGKIMLLKDELLAPLHWRKPWNIFVNSMSDLFHEDVPDEFIASVFNIMGMAEQHTFQVLTKRSERMLAFLNSCRPWKNWITTNNGAPAMAYNGTGIIAGDVWNWPPKNVLLGVSVENQAAADERLESMRAIAALDWFTWVSYEPALSAVDWTPWSNFIKWFVAGGESGIGARPADPAWIMKLRDVCQAARIPFLFKQWGAWAPWEFDSWDPNKFTVFYFDGNGGEPRSVFKVGKKLAGRSLECRIWNEFPAPSL